MSRWVEYDRATGSTVDQRLTALIAADGPVAVTEPVIMKVLLSHDADMDRLAGAAGITPDAASLRAT